MRNVVRSVVRRVVRGVDNDEVWMLLDINLPTKNVRRLLMNVLYNVQWYSEVLT